MSSPFARLAGASVAALSLAASASAQSFSDETAWQAAAGHWQTETFDSYVSMTQVAELPGVGLSVDFLNTGNVHPAVMSTSATGGSSISPPNVLVNQSQPTLPGLGAIRMRPLAPGVTIRAVGYWNTGGDDSTELRLYDGSGGLLAASNTGSASLVFNGIVAATPAAYFEIDTGGIGNGYITLDNLSVTLEGPAWTSYCPTSPNSVGPGAILTLVGPQVWGTTQASLQVAGSVPNQPSIFFCGPVQTNVPFGLGRLCIARGAGGIFRLSHAVTVDPNGFASMNLDFATDPLGGSTNAAAPGVPLNFQYWYFDPGWSGNDVNLSDAIQATFYP